MCCSPVTTCGSAYVLLLPRARVPGRHFTRAISSVFSVINWVIRGFLWAQMTDFFHWCAPSYISRITYSNFRLIKQSTFSKWHQWRVPPTHHHGVILTRLKLVVTLKVLILNLKFTSIITHPNTVDYYR